MAIKSDFINHPSHYTNQVPNIECIEVTEHFNFNRGNAMKYLWRAGDKGDAIRDLKKAAWYIQREIKRLGQLKTEKRGVEMELKRSNMVLET